DEARALQDHLAACGACRAALAQAEAQQSLLARAAQVYTEVPAFAAPSAEPVAHPAAPPTPAAAPVPVETPPPATAAPPAPATLPVAGNRPARRWPWLSAAAAVLLAAFGVHGYFRYQEGLESRQGELARARREVEAVDVRLARAERAYWQETAALPKQLEAA